MADVRLAIVYYSTYGTNHRMAEIAARGGPRRGRRGPPPQSPRDRAPTRSVAAQDAWSAQAEKTSDIPEATPDDLVWANAFLFSSPTRYGGAASQMRSFIDTLGPVWQEGKLADKAFSAMTSAANVHGGQGDDAPDAVHHRDALGRGPRAAGLHGRLGLQLGAGNPYGASITQDPGVTPEKEAVIRHQATRLVQMAAKLAA